MVILLISDKVSDMDSEIRLHNENNVPDFNSAQESETSAVSTKTAEAKTGKFLCDILSRQEVAK